MDAVETLLLDEPLGPTLIAISTVLLLSLAGPPWVKAVGRDRGTPNLIDRWKLCAWLHPVQAGLLKRSAVLTLGAMVTVPTVILASRYDIAGSPRQVTGRALSLIRKRAESRRVSTALMVLLLACVITVTLDLQQPDRGTVEIP